MPVNPATQLPAPTRARRAEPRKAPPYKWYLLGGAIFALICVVALVVTLVFVVKFAEDKGYDPELSKKYPGLALFVLAKKSSKTGDEFVIDSDRGIVTYREMPSGTRVRKQELNGTIISLPLDDDEKTDTITPPPPVIPEPRKRIKPAPRKSQKDNF